MKAVYFNEHGNSSVLRFGEIADPQSSAGSALLKVKAVALNHLDIWVRRGWSGLKLTWPHVSGSDVCGEIIAGPEGSGWRPGDRVVVNPGLCCADDEWTRSGAESVSPSYQILGEQVRGGMAELITVPLQNLFPAPLSWSDEEAAAPLLTGLTAWRMLFKQAELKPGESVLIVGAGGGVNSISISFAKAAGATVFALSSSAAKLERAAALGAEHLVNYREQPAWHKEILKLTGGRGVDVVVDNVGAATMNSSLRAAARGGRVVTVGNTSGPVFEIDNRLIFTKQLSYIGSTMGSRQDFIDMLKYMQQQRIKPIIDAVAPLREGIEMLHRLETGEQFGKIVLTP